MKTRHLGDVKVGAIGLGAWPMSAEGRPDERRCVATIHAALETGVTLIDTADAYHWHRDEVGHNESLIARALRAYGSRASSVLIATKGGHVRPGDGSWLHRGSPRHLKAACEASLRRLGIEAIGLYQLHRPDPTVPFADSVGALRDLMDEGKILQAGISNVSEEQIRVASDLLRGRLASVQNELSPAVRNSEPELRLCEQLGVAFLPWRPFGGTERAKELAVLHAPFGEVGRRHGVSAHRVCIAWLLAKSPAMIPIPGCTRPESIRDCVAALDLSLSQEELAALDT